MSFIFRNYKFPSHFITLGIANPFQLPFSFTDHCEGHRLDICILSTWIIQEYLIARYKNI